MSQTDVVISGAKRMLSSRRLRPGDRLPVEKDLAAELQVSRGSLREGVRVNQVHAVRRALETEAAAAAAASITGQQLAEAARILERAGAAH